MKILQINNVYGEKSTGKITRELHKGLLQAGHESVVVYGRGKNTTDAGVIRLCPDWYGKMNSLLSRFTGIRHGGCLLSTYRLQRIILREKPDIVHLQCINGNFVNIFRIVRWLNQNKRKTVLTLHAEFMYTANCGHAFDCDQWKCGCKQCPNRKKATKSILFDRTGFCWNRMKAAFDGFAENCVIVPVSPWTQMRAKESEIVQKIPMKTVFNGIDTDVFFGKTGIAQEKLVLHVTAEFSEDPMHLKGGWYLIQMARKFPEVTFLVAGKAGDVKNLPENLMLLGEVCDQRDLAELYRKAQLSIVVSRKETFSMPCAESLCCGTPVIGFKAGAPEQISLPEFSEFVEFGDVVQLENLLRKWLGKKDIDPGCIAQKAAETYSSQTMVRNYLDVYGSALWN